MANDGSRYNCEGTIYAPELADIECLSFDSMMISSPDRMLYEYSCFVGYFISSGP